MNKKPLGYGTMASTSDVGPPSAEINRLCDNIETNIYTINQSCRTLEGYSRSLGTAQDNQGLRNKIHVTHISANEIMSATTANIHHVTVAVRKCEKQLRLQVEKLTDNFKEVVAKYCALQKQVAEKMKLNLLVTPPAESDDPEVIARIQQQATLSRELAFEEDMLLDRETQVRQIESDIIDINQIMRELSTLVAAQGEGIDNVENNVERATGHIEEGTDHLFKASGYVSRYRKKLFILAAIALIVAAILVTVLVLSLKR